MGLGGYLAARTDQEHFASEERREYFETDKLPEQEKAELREIFKSYGLQGAELDAVVAALSKDKDRWAEYMMRFELGLERPDPKRAPISAATIAASYIVGGLIPLAPLYACGGYEARLALLDFVHRDCADRFRSRERHAYGDEPFQIGVANPARRRTCGGSGVLSGVGIRLMTAARLATDDLRREAVTEVGVGFHRPP